MSVYIARPLKGNQRPSPLFRQKGLGSLTPCAISNSGVQGVPHRKQIAYGAYTQFLSAFLMATEHNRRISTSNPGFPITLKASQTLELPMPPLGVAFPQKLSNDKLKRLDDAYGCKTVTSMGQTIYLFDNASLALAKELVSMNAITDSRNPGGVATLAGLSSYHFCLKVLTLFCATHTYPAFSTPLSDPTTVHNYESDTELRIPENLEVPASKRRRTIPNDGDVDEEMAGEDQEDVELIVAGQTRAMTMKEVVFVAKPAKFVPVINFGPAANVPSMSGLVFPYFHEMISPDFSILPSIMWRYFLQSFGIDRDHFTKGYKAWEKSSKTWVSSNEGLVMQHIFYGIQLALETQARVYFVVQKDVYQGFVLLGEGFSVLAHDREYLPESAEIVRQELTKISAHDNALGEIVKMLRDCVIEKTKKRGKLETTDITCNRELYEAVHVRRISDEEGEALMRLVNDLSFPERYWKPSPGNIDNLLRVYTEDEGQHPAQTPMYIGSGLLMSKDDAYLSLSPFGPTAPSFFTVGGDKIPIPAPGRPDPQSVLDQSTGKPVMPFIPYTMKSIKVAAADLYKVWNDRAVYVLPRERAGPSRTTQYIGDARDTVWESLRIRIGGREVTTTKKASAPRAADKDVVTGKVLAFGDALDFD